MKGRLSSNGAILEITVSASRERVKHGGGIRTYSALVDTGAELSFISPDVVAGTAPTLLRYVYINQANGSGAYAASYDVRFRFGDDGSPGLWLDAEAPMVQPATPDVDIIIGRDLLQAVRMTWDGPGGSFEVEYP